MAVRNPTVASSSCARAMRCAGGYIVGAEAAAAADRWPGECGGQRDQDSRRLAFLPRLKSQVSREDLL
jgi:hypothetical protein